MTVAKKEERGILLLLFTVFPQLPPTPGALLQCGEGVTLRSIGFQLFL